MGIQVSGLLANSAFDWKSIVDQLIEAESTPVKTLTAEKTRNSDQATALAAIKTAIQDMQNSVQAMRTDTVFAARGVSSDVANTSWKSNSANGAPAGSYKFAVSQLASAAAVRGAKDVGAALSATADVSGLTVASLRTGSAVTAGAFTVNGGRVDVSLTDSLETLFTKISSATGGVVKASYDPVTDGMKLVSSSGRVVLGASNDTSNFLAVMKLANNGSSTVASSSTLGTLKLSGPLSAAGLRSTVSPAGGTGTFKINGVEISYDMSKSLSELLSGINKSGAGVTASYDSAADRVVLTNQKTGDMGLSVSDDADGLLGALGIPLSANLGASLSSTADVSGLNLGDLRIGMPIEAGTFTVNGSEVSVTLADSLEEVFAKISIATAGVVTASYDPALDAITLGASSGNVELGGTGDTSNFLSAMKLAANGTPNVSSSGPLGTLKLTGPLASAGLQTPVGAPAVVGGLGSFSINGVSIGYDMNTDSLSTVLSRINASAAGVTASYDSATDRVVLSDPVSGSLTVSEETNGLLASLGVTSNAATVIGGKNAQFKVDDGTLLTSTSNTLEASVHGIEGLSVTVNALSAQTQTITVASDAAGMTTSVQDFIDKYNTLQDLIETHTKIEVIGTNITRGVLAGTREVDGWASRLRSLVFAPLSGVDGSVKRLDDLGIDFDGVSGHLAVKDPDKLATALSDRPDEVEAFFTNGTGSFVAKVFGEAMVAMKWNATEQEKLTKASSSIDTQINDLQTRLTSQRERLTTAFIAMLDAQSKAQSQNTYLTNQYFKDNSSN